VPKLLQEFLCQYLTESYNLGCVRIAWCVPRSCHNLFCVIICTSFLTALFWKGSDGVLSLIAQLQSQYILLHKINYGTT
jgi:hypothetical protein